jgi:hypothetical protein
MIASRPAAFYAIRCAITPTRPKECSARQAARAYGVAFVGALCFRFPELMPQLREHIDFIETAFERATREEREVVGTSFLENLPRPGEENPASGVRPGQLHLQDYSGNKYQYNFDTGEFDGLPNKLAKSLAKDPGFKRAIATGRRYLGM